MLYLFFFRILIIFYLFIFSLFIFAQIIILLQLFQNKNKEIKISIFYLKVISETNCKYYEQNRLRKNFIYSYDQIDITIDIDIT